MEQINIQTAKTHLSSLVDKAASGEAFIIAKAGRPLVVVVPYKGGTRTSRIGFLKGEISVPDDFDQIGSDDIGEIFYGAK